jgi:uncharacterized protein
VTEFAPLSALAGGALIGFAAVLLMLGIGRVAGVSGILLSMFTGRAFAAVGWRFAFLVGMPLGAALLAAFGWKDFQSLSFPAGAIATIIAGLLVGAGTTLGSGCTSGHGICGLARISTRSIFATLTFMATAAATVFVVRHLV